MSASKRILNVADVDLQPFPVAPPGALAERFECRMGQIGAKIGAQKLGYNVTVVPAGKRAFPFHNHHVNEEMFFVLEGEGEVRIGAERHAIKRGDVIACPPGNADHAHQIVNTSSQELKYLAVSTKVAPEIAEYPDAKKFGILGEGFRFLGRVESSLGYWDGE